MKNLLLYGLTFLGIGALITAIALPGSYSS